MNRLLLIIVCCAACMIPISLPAQDSQTNLVLKSEMTYPGHTLYPETYGKKATVKVLLYPKHERCDAVVFGLPRRQVKLPSGELTDILDYFVFGFDEIYDLKKLFDNFASFRRQLEEFKIRPFTKNLGRIVATDTRGHNLRKGRIYDFAIHVSDKGESYLIVEEQEPKIAAIFSDERDYIAGCVTIFSSSDVDFLAQMANEACRLEGEAGKAKK